MKTIPMVLVFLAIPSLDTSAQERERPGISVRDTSRSGETALRSGETQAAFMGDAVVTNGRLSVVAAKGAASVEVRIGTTPRARLELVASDGGPVAKLARVALVENGRGAATLEAAGETARRGGPSS